eukprot:Nk52_evm13s157 gene=Nk52_evmTU13s157
MDEALLSVFEAVGVSEAQGHAFLLTLVAGLSTGLGGLVVISLGRDLSQGALGFLMAFASGVMLYVSVFDLFWEGVEDLGLQTTLLCTSVGIIIFALFVKVLPEPDLTEVHEKMKRVKAKSVSGKISEVDEAEIFHTALVTALSVSLHNLPEGAAVYFSCLKGLHLGIPMAIAIAGHNIPEGLCVAAPLFYATRDRWQCVKWATLSGVCEPIGAILIGAFFHPYLTHNVMSGMLAGVGGIMVFMCFKELIPTACKACSSIWMVIFGHVVGAAVMYSVNTGAKIYLGVDLV